MTPDALGSMSSFSLGYCKHRHLAPSGPKFGGGFRATYHIKITYSKETKLSYT